MTPPLSLSQLFSATEPAAASLPHLITLLDGELIGKVSQLTRTRPGLWPLPAPFDENDCYNEVREAAKFADWGLPLNQAEVQAVGRLVRDALFGANLLLMSSAIDEQAIEALAQPRGRRLQNGAWFTPGYQDLPELPGIVELAGWILIPIGPGRSRALFVAAPALADWVGKLKDWCDRQGRDVWKVIRVEQASVLSHQPAPPAYREQAVRRRIDAFLGEMEVWFGDSGEGIGARVQARVDSLGDLREKIARARQGAP